MTERPILMSAPMVRAILAGTKTQTRRVVKLPQPLHPQFGARAPLLLAHDDEGIELYLHSRVLPRPIRSPYGTVGDRLWVREAWRRDIFDDTKTLYRATHGDRTVFDKWVPSIHMPRTRSRITLQVTGVRVERLQDITHRDIEAEGIPCAGAPRPTLEQRAEHCVMWRSLWESINGTGSWDANPWVWVVEFTRVEKSA